MDNHRRHCSVGRSERVGNAHQPRFHGSQYRGDHSYREQGREQGCNIKRRHSTREDQQQSLHHSTYRGRSRSPIQSREQSSSSGRGSFEEWRQPHRGRELGRDSHHRYQKHHYDVRKTDVKSAFKSWDEERLRDLARTTDQDIVEVLFNDQIAFFNMLNKENILKDARKFRLLVQILHNLSSTTVPEEKSGHMISLLSQIVSSKCSTFYQVLSVFVRSIPSEQAIKKRDENFETLTWILDIFHKMLSVVPQKCVMLPLNDLRGTALQLQQIHSRYDNCVTAANRLVEMYRTFESSNIKSSYDYRCVPVLPKVDEITRITKPNLQANIVEGSYQNWGHYLHIQFSLLREDFISPLRQGICDYRRGFEDRSRHSIRVYKHVCIREPICLYTGIGFQIQFDTSYRHLRRIDWEHSRRLSFGSLLCLFSETFHTVFFATVVGRDPKLLKDGILKVQFENTSVSDILEINPQREFVMVESTAYFEAYRHILNRLQQIEEDPPSFKSYIVDCRSLESVPSPSYLTVKKLDVEDSYFDFSALDCSHSVNILDSHTWPHHEEVSLDKSQLAAVQMALTQEISVIQGPPGTGKTYIGLKIVEILLQNKAKWDPLLQSPILVVCYTNHALDQFLEGILNFMKDGDTVNMVRVGGRCRSEAIQPYSLQVLVRQHKLDKCHDTKYEQGQLNQAKSIMDSKHRDINEDLQKVSKNNEEKKPVILELQDLEPVIHYKHIQQLKRFASQCTYTEKGSEIETWLLTISHEDDMPHKQQKSTRVSKLTEDKETASNNDLDDAHIDMDAEAALLENDRIIDGERIELEPLLGEKESPNIDNKRLYKHKFDSHKPLDYSTQQIKEGMNNKPMSERAAQNIQDITHLKSAQKWSLYLYWATQYLQRCKQKVACHVETYAAACEEYQKARTELDYAVMRKTHVVGMTTTGASKYHGILQKLRPKIIIVEEAAEVLESHVVTTLTASTQQIIMIGDHQQLRPKPNDYHLATNCNLEVSLFERLIKNKIPFATLEVQHRMRPEIAQLICPHIYPDLINAPNVHEYNEMDGVKHNVFFINHTVAEDDISVELMSHSNEFEAKFVIQLCYYFIKRGYSHHQITILTMYSGQILKIKKLISKELLNGIRISSVDNFQGEENDIIILSLVRSNEKGRVGFLKESNRVCVALSRAKMGLYVIGNFDMLKKEGGTEWMNIIGDMEKRELMGSSLLLYCSHHNENTSVSSGDDFLAKSPQGGCLKPCGVRLPCGHSCSEVCHIDDRDHVLYQCHKMCNKSLRCSHKCISKCFECKDGCKPCQFKVTKLLLCGHSAEVNCSRNLKSYVCTKLCTKTLACGHKCKELCHKPCKCKVLVFKQLPCGHSTKKKIECWKQISSINCDKPCNTTLQCGHRCSGDCYSCYKGRLHKRCNAGCGRVLPCGHTCDFPCTKECPPCGKPCGNHCIHSKCRSKCGDPCVPCMEACQWRCKHLKCNRRCGEMCDRPRCNSPCTKHLKCGHACIGLCGEKCPTLCRICNKAVVTDIFFGTENEPNARFIQLEDCGHIFEVSGLDRWMDQQDSGTDSKAVEIQFKCCPKCKTSVRRSLRYGNIIKQTLHDMERIKKELIKSDTGSHELLTKLAESLPLLRSQLCGEDWCERFRQFINGTENTIERNLHDTTKHYQGIQSKMTIHEVNTIQFQLENLLKFHKLFATAHSLTKGFEFDKIKVQRADIETKLCDLWDFTNKRYLSDQCKLDIEHEYNRLSAVTNLCKICEALLSLGSIDEDDLKTLNELAVQLFAAGTQSSNKITNKRLTEYFVKFEEFKKKYGIGYITEQERIEIVKAVGLSQGHWFKCPNGHYYCIGECGGAMELAKCPECKADIGGTSHQLTSGNVHAGEMDGSRHAAWSDAANLQNYDPADVYMDY